MKPIISLCFALTVLLQLYFPIQSIWDSEKVLQKGVAYAFKLQPIDPVDPFRGRYMRLSFEANTWKTADDISIEQGERVGVKLRIDNAGFAQIDRLIDLESGQDDYDLTARTTHFNQWWHQDTMTVTIAYDFDRFYLEENQAQHMDTILPRLLRDTNYVAQAVVYIHEKEARLQDVLVNDTSIKYLLGEHYE